MKENQVKIYDSIPGCGGRSRYIPIDIVVSSYGVMKTIFGDESQEVKKNAPEKVKCSLRFSLDDERPTETVMSSLTTGS